MNDKERDAAIEIDPNTRQQLYDEIMSEWRADPGYVLGHQPNLQAFIYRGIDAGYAARSREIEDRLARAEAWNARASCFEVVSGAGWALGTSQERPVNIEKRLQRDGSERWIVKTHEWILARDGQWVYEPMPSNRTDEFIELTRYDSPESALDAYESLKENK